LVNEQPIPITVIDARNTLDKSEFSQARRRLGKTQKVLAELLGVSLKTIHSYEQGWRSIPSHIERQLYFLIANQKDRRTEIRPCWEVKQCNLKLDCPAWEFQSGHLCWFLCGTLCECGQYSTCKEKIEICRKCEIFQSLLK